MADTPKVEGTKKEDQEPPIKSRKWKIWTALTHSDRIAALALLISVFTVVLGVMGSYQDIRYKKLLTRPMLSLDFADGSDDKFTGIILRNRGLGPARILNVQLFIDSDFVSEAYDDEEWTKVLRTLGRKNPEQQLTWDVRFRSFQSDAYLPAGESIPLLFQRNDQLTQNSLKALRFARNHLALSVCFCSLYSECWQLVSPGLKASPCESPLAAYYLGKGPLAARLRGIQRVVEPWSPQ